MKFIGIIGDPIEHSLSPAMQNAAFRRANLPFVYLPFRVRPGELKSFLEKARWKMVGLNVTIPHKETIVRHLDRISPEARAIGAVNTVVIRGGRLLGYNTDGKGYLQSLKNETGFNPKGKRILIIGAGGAARALIYSLRQAGAQEIHLANRTKKRVLQIPTIPLQKTAFKKILPSIDLLINATSVGLNGTRFRGLPLSSLPKGAVVSDLVYRPRMTPLLKEAKKRGFRIHTGIGMLLHQGAMSFRLWTGKNPDLEAMRKALQKTAIE